MIPDPKFVTQKKSWAPNYPRILAISYGASLLVGVFVSSIAPLLMPIALSFKLPVSQIALPVSMRSGGFLTGCMVVSTLWTEKRAKTMLTFATIIFTISLFFLALPFISLLALLGFFFVSGVGFGLLVAGLNSLVSQISAHARAKNLTNLSIFFGIGAVIGPLLVTFILKQGVYWSLFHLVLLFPASIVLVLIARCQLSPQCQATSTEHEIKSKNPPHTSLPIKYGAFWIIFFVSLLIMGAQVSFSSLIPAFLVQGKGLAVSTSNYAISLFWMIFIIGGLLYAYLFSHRNLWLLVLIGTAIACISTLFTILAHQPWQLFVTVACSGLFFSYLFPVIISLAGTLFPLRIGFVTGGLMSTSGIGGIVFPSLIGFTINSIGFGNAFFLIPALLVFALLILLVFRRVISA